MKKIVFLFAISFTMVLFTSCSKDEIEASKNQQSVDLMTNTNTYIDENSVDVNGKKINPFHDCSEGPGSGWQPINHPFINSTHSTFQLEGLLGNELQTASGGYTYGFFPDFDIPLIGAYKIGNTYYMNTANTERWYNELKCRLTQELRNNNCVYPAFGVNVYFIIKIERVGELLQ